MGNGPTHSTSFGMLLDWFRYFLMLGSCVAFSGSFFAEKLIAEVSLPNFSKPHSVTWLHGTVLLGHVFGSHHGALLLIGAVALCHQINARFGWLFWEHWEQCLSSAKIESSQNLLSWRCPQKDEIHWAQVLLRCSEDSAELFRLPNASATVRISSHQMTDDLAPFRTSLAEIEWVSLRFQDFDVHIASYCEILYS